MAHDTKSKRRRLQPDDAMVAAFTAFGADFKADANGVERVWLGELRAGLADPSEFGARAAAHFLNVAAERAAAAEEAAAEAEEIAARAAAAEAVAAAEAAEAAAGGGAK